MKSIPDWLLFVGNKKALFLLLFTIISCAFLNVNANEISACIDETKKGTIDPDSYETSKKELGCMQNISITNAPETDTLIAIKILNVYYNPTTNVITHEFTNNFKNFLTSTPAYKNFTIKDYYNLTSGDITSGSTLTNSTLDKLVSKYITYAYANMQQIISDVTQLEYDSTGIDLGGVGHGMFVTAGTYLIIPYSTYGVYAPMVGNITFEPNSSGVYEKQSKVTKIVAKISNPTGNFYVGSIGNLEANYNIGTEFTYYTNVTIPIYPTNATNKVYSIKYTLDSGIALPGSTSIVIKDSLETMTTKSDGTVVNSAGKTIATISISGQNMTITFNTNNITSNAISISYKATLNSKAVLGSSGNNNKVDLIYSTTPYTSGSTTVSSTTIVYTYGIDLLAYKKGDKSTTLSDMTFDIYKDSSLTQKVGTITTGSSGKGTLAGVAEGTYYIKNTKAKSGYALATTTSMKVKISGSVASTTDGYYKVEIEVPEAKSLPLTGGTGTIIYIGIGLLLITVSTIAFVTYNKKQIKKYN